MKRNLIPICIIVLLLFLNGYGCNPCTPNPDAGSLAVTLDPQQQSNWCWAASGEMCMNFLGASVVQCDEANKEFSSNDCCNNPVPTLCNNGGWPQFQSYGFTASITNDSALSFADIQTQISCLQKPVAFSWHWNSGGGHMMVVTGYSVIDGVQYLNINDPWEPNVGAQYTITYADYVSGSDHTHWNDYYNITKNGSN